MAREKDSKLMDYDYMCLSDLGCFPTSGDPFRADFCANCIKLRGLKKSTNT